jgi:hypothetical protein
MSSFISNAIHIGHNNPDGSDISVQQTKPYNTSGIIIAEFLFYNYMILTTNFILFFL